MNYRERKAGEVLEALDLKLDEVEDLIRQLPIKTVIKDQLVDRIYDLWSEIEDNLDMTPVDFED